MRRTLFDDEHDDFRASVRTFVEREVIPHHDRWREQGGMDRELWLAAGRADFLGISIPGEHGGSGTGDFRFNVVLTEELARVSLALASSVGIHTDVVAPYLTELTTEEQKARWLPGFCTGETVSAIGMTEPSAGSDLASLRTQARANGNGWVVNGSKTFITNGASADLVIIAARTGKHMRDISLFAIEASSEGFTRGRKLHKIGQPEADTSELFFEDVHVTEDHLLGRLDRGFVAMMERLPQERLHSACANVAHAREALSQTLEYARDRIAFGRPIGTFQHNRFVLAELVTELDVAQSFVDACVAQYVIGKLDDVDTAKAKWWSASVQNRIIDACLQLHGGYGYMDEYPVARAWTDARVTKIWAGSNEIMKEVIGRSLGFGEVRDV
ncbi:MAG: acyl-CoA dehydrogenase domain protein [Solirubrobacterales bacterium]|jgi:alkylation response protein AidB-like acyl-CoA dehydrogenase|nr:acyl-CoA dehydrogenase domain protein [Solirubrobacterales bacterium]